MVTVQDNSEWVWMAFPAAASGMALLLLAMEWRSGDAGQRRERWVMVGLVLSALVSLCQMRVYGLSVEVFYQSLWLGMLATSCWWVFFYRMVFESTRTHYRERFSSGIWAFPPVYTVLAIGWFYASGPGWRDPEERVLEVVVLNALLGGLVALFCLRRASQYWVFLRDYVSNVDTFSLGWMLVSLGGMLLLMIFPVMGSTPVRNGLESLVVVCWMAHLLHHVLRRDQRRIVLSREAEVPLVSGSKKNALNREVLEAFMEVQKPHLNPDLRITDLVRKLGVNRTYISSFINVEYGMHFAAFINRYRMLEFYRLLGDPSNQRKERSELAERSGFNSYRSFMRIKKEFDRTGGEN